ncbi:MAG TPA: hypothetical protein VH540_11740 [Ktedonobacterales bacterium]|jgi:hypothetical protein
MQRRWNLVVCFCALAGLLLSSAACGQTSTSSAGSQASTPTPTATPSPTPTASPTDAPTANGLPAGVLLSGRAPFGGQRGPFSLNLDTGKAGTSPDQGDFFLVAETARDGNTPNYCAVVSLGNAAFVNLGNVDFNSVTLAQLKRASYGQNLLRCFTNADGSNQLTSGDVFAVFTNGHHYAKVLVESNNFVPALAVTFQWVTFK